MQIKYSRHIETMLALRKIEYVLPKRIYEDADVKLLTIHPLKEGQKENRIQSGRWRKI